MGLETNYQLSVVEDKYEIVAYESPKLTKGVYQVELVIQQVATKYMMW